MSRLDVMRLRSDRGAYQVQSKLENSNILPHSTRMMPQATPGSEPGRPFASNEWAPPQLDRAKAR